jgi:hypothetical protein
MVSWMKDYYEESCSSRSGCGEFNENDWEYEEVENRSIDYWDSEVYVGGPQKYPKSGSQMSRRDMQKEREYGSYTCKSYEHTSYDC